MISNVTVIILMIAAGVVMGLLFIIIYLKNRKEDYEVVGYIEEHDSLRTPEDALVEPESGEIRDSINIIGKDISKIYIYNAFGDRAERRVWECRYCETENHIESGVCMLCGAERE